MAGIRRKPEKKTEAPESSERLERQKELAQLALDDLFFFNQYILGNAKVMNEGLHREMCDFATGYREFLGNKKKRLLLEPRFTLKSTCVTIAYPLQLMLKKPNIRVLIDSENLAQAKAFLTSIKGHCEMNDRYRDLSKFLYGKVPVPASKKDWDVKWTSSEIICPLRFDQSIKEPTISCGGVDVVKVGSHYDVVIMDDPVSNNNTTTREQMEKVIQHYKLVLSLLDPGGILIIIGTRWDYGDLYGYIIENHQKFFDVLLRKAYHEDGTLLYPERLNQEFLDEQRISQGPYIFSTQYLNEPVPREDATFRWDRYREWVGEFEESTGKVKVKELRKYTGETTYDVIGGESTLLVNVFLTVDPAVSTKETADPTGMVVTGVDTENRMFVVDYSNKRIQGQEFYDELFRLVAQYNPRRVGVEAGAFQKSIAINVRDEMRRRNVFFLIEELKPDTDKIRRIQTLQPRYDAGQIYLKTGMDELKYQMINFPRTPHDDLIDALAYQLQVVYSRRKKDRDEEAKPKYHYRSEMTRY